MDEQQDVKFIKRSKYIKGFLAIYIKNIVGNPEYQKYLKMAVKHVTFMLGNLGFIFDYLS